MPNRARRVVLLVLALVAAVGPATAQSLSWTATYDGGPTAGWSNAGGPHGIAVDAQANTYVSASVSSGVVPEPSPYGGGGVRALLVKYGPSGQALWSREVGPGTRILGIILDDLEQPLVLAGDATLKYSTSGNLLWRTPHLAAGRMGPAAIALAPGGGAYLAGSLWDSTTGLFDLALARLDGLGRLVWLRTWNGAQDLDDEAQGVAVDAAGTIYVTGRSQKQAFPKAYSYVTVAFAANGDLSWTHLVDSVDYRTPAAYAVDPLNRGFFLSVPLGQGQADFRTVRYDEAGVISWSRDFSDLSDLEFGTPDAAAVAPDGVLYVAGHSAPSGFPEIVGYSTSGVQRWAHVGSTTSLSQDATSLLAVDGSSRAIVVRTLESGHLGATVYDPSGATVWSKDLAWTAGNPLSTASLSAAGVAVAPLGLVRIAATSNVGTAGPSLVTFGYDDAGSFQFGKEPPPFAPDEGAVAVRFDPSGNAVVLATGVTDGQTFFRTLQYGPAGQLSWSRSAFSGPFTRPMSLAVGVAGEVVAAGIARGPAGDEIATVKYDATGTEAWTRTYIPPGFITVWPGSGVAVALDSAGNVYVTGRVSGADDRAVVVKYAPDGSFLWVRTGAYPIVDEVQPVGPFVAVSPNGNVIVAGSAYQPIGTSYHSHAWSLDSAGNTLWNRVGTLGSKVDALVVDSSGNVIVGDFYSGRVDKLSPAGAQLWSVVSGDRVMALSVDSTGAVAVASSDTDALGFVPRLAKYGPTGDLLWSRALEPKGGWAYGLRSAADGGVYAAGKYTDFALGSQSTAFVAAYDGTGQTRWARSFSGVGSGPANFNDLDVDAAGRLVAAGYAFGGATSYDVLVQSMTDDAPAPLLFHTLAPCRAFDSRDAAKGGPAAVPANAAFEAQVTGLCGVPTSARSVALNVTVTGSTAPGHVTVFPAGRVPPPTSNINHVPGITRAAQAVVGLGDDGRVAVRAIQAGGSVNVILDVSGYFE